MKKIAILGSDKRSKYLRELYIQNNVKLYEYHIADIVIAPIPFSKDGIKITGENILVADFVRGIKGKILLSGAYSSESKKLLGDVEYYDLMSEDSLAILNAIPTAEGAIFEAMKNTDTTLCNSNCLVMGYGRIGKVLAKMLSGIGANVYCEARKKKDLANIKAMGYNEVDISELESVLPNMDYIFNTIPVVLLDENMLKLVNKDALIIDLASTPGGVDFEKARQLDLNVVWALALPSKIAPKTAAIYLKDTIDNFFCDNGIKII